MRRKRFIVMAIVLLASCPQRTSRASDPETSAMEQDIQEVLKQRRLPAAGIVLVRGEAEIYVKGIGLADKEASIPATSKSLFYLASISKSFTAVALMMLRERGKIRLEDRLKDVVFWKQDRWIVSPFWGGKLSEWIPLSQRLLRRPESPIATGLVASDLEGDPVLIAPGTPFLNYVRLPAWRVALEIGLTVYAGLMTVTAAPVALLFLVARWGNSARGKYPCLWILTMPVPSILLLAGLFTGLSWIKGPDSLATITPVSLALFISTLGFAVFTLFGAFISLLAWKGRGSVLFRAYALSVAGSNLVVLGYLAYWGMIPWRTWTL